MFISIDFNWKVARIDARQVNYYIVVPSSDDYAQLLHAPATLCGVIIGSMPLSALLSSLVYSWWSNFSYTAPLIVSTLILMIGNLMYALALYFNSIWLLLLGRFFCGYVTPSLAIFFPYSQIYADHCKTVSSYTVEFPKINSSPKPTSIYILEWRIVF